MLFSHPDTATNDNAIERLALQVTRDALFQILVCPNRKVLGLPTTGMHKSQIFLYTARDLRRVQTGRDRWIAEVHCIRGSNQ